MHFMQLANHPPRLTAKAREWRRMRRKRKRRVRHEEEEEGTGDGQK